MHKIHYNELLDDDADAIDVLWLIDVDEQVELAEFVLDEDEVEVTLQHDINDKIDVILLENEYDELDELDDELAEHVISVLETDDDEVSDIVNDESDETEVLLIEAQECHIHILGHEFDEIDETLIWVIDEIDEILLEVNDELEDDEILVIENDEIDDVGVERLIHLEHEVIHIIEIDDADEIMQVDDALCIDAEAVPYIETD